jgi:hypothetical protein
MAKQTFTTGQVLTAAQMTSLQQTAMGGGSTTAKTTSYVLVAADAGTVVQMNSASATTITVNTALFAAGDTVQIQNVGSGVCTVTAGTATVSTSAVLALKQYDAGSLYFNSTSAALFFAADAADNTSPLTTKGDLYTFSTANDRLAVGTNGQTLVADSSTSTGLKWATAAAASSGLTLITRSTFSNVASVTIASVFSSTYKTYLVNIEHCHGETTSTQDLGFQLRYATTNQTTGCYSTAVYWATGTSATAANVGANNTSYFNLNKTLGSQDFAGTSASFTIQNVGQTDEYALYYGSGTDYNDQLTYLYGGQASVARTYTGIVFLPDSGNITGQISIYGLATA